ncbi:hypothetical protein DFS34DRAFT_696841 [Phlyctochytrium arcticum]|nr:hypothetical protein DFS34DRAFT_696841 [Phlyctochytrium arcticum]
MSPAVLTTTVNLTCHSTFPSSPLSTDSFPREETSSFHSKTYSPSATSKSKAKAYLKDGCINEAVLDPIQPSDQNFGVYVFTVDEKAYAGSGTRIDKGGLYKRGQEHINIAESCGEQPGQAAAQAKYRRYRNITKDSKLAVYVVLHTDALSREEILTFKCVVQVLGEFYRLIAPGYYGTREELAQWGRAGVQSQLQQNGKSALTAYLGYDTWYHDDRKERIRELLVGADVNLVTKKLPKSGREYISKDFKVLAGSEIVTINRAALVKIDPC